MGGREGRPRRGPSLYRDKSRPRSAPPPQRERMRTEEEEEGGGEKPIKIPTEHNKEHGSFCAVAHLASRRVRRAAPCRRRWGDATPAQVGLDWIKKLLKGRVFLYADAVS